MKELKRFLALFLCLTMLFSAVPMQVFATEAESEEPVVTEPVVEEETPAPEETEAPAVEETEPPVEEETEAPAVEETEAPVEEPTLPEQIEEPAPDADASVNAQTESSVVKVEEVGGDVTYFDTLQDAFKQHFDYTNNTAMGGTYIVTLLADCDRAEISAKTDAYIAEPFDITLDLNGHSIISSDSTKSVLSITIGSKNYPSTFTIKDSYVDENGNTNTGKITGGKYGIVFGGEAATLNFEGGTITGNHGGTTGGGICASGGKSYVVIKGGVITGNSVTGTSSANTGLGGGVYGTHITVTGGEIYGNYAYGGTGNYTGRGGGICTTITGTAGYHVVTITGGKIYDNHADNAGDDLMIQKNSVNAGKQTFTLSGSNWYIDGWNGTNQTSGETDRYSEENPVPYTEGGWESGTKKAVGLKYVEAPAVPTYTVTYTDGVEDVDVFADQSYTVDEGSATPAFEGTPARDGYKFVGWEPEVAETVTADATYTALWEELPPIAGDINGVGLRDDNEGICLELHNVTYYESVVVEVYSGETLLTTLTLNEGVEEKGVVVDALTASIRTTGESSSWTATGWNPHDKIIPDNYKLYIDGVLMDTHEETVDAEVWAALIGTAGGDINGVTFRSDNEGLSLELHNVLAYKSIEVKVYSGETYLTTVSLREEYYEQFLNVVQDALTVSIRTGEEESTTWAATEWAPCDDVVPDYYELYIDGVLVDTHSETVDTQTWVDLVGTAPSAPDKYGKNVTTALVRVICDSDSNHEPIDIKWQSQSTKVRTWVSGVVWSEEENAWIVPIRIDSISAYYVWLNFEKAYNDILHDLVPDAPIPEGLNYIDTYLKWDETQQLWVTMDGNPIEVHVCCQTVPEIPTGRTLGTYQIQVKADLDGDGIYGETANANDGVGELYTTTIPEEYYKDLVVRGSREEGFFVDITIPLANDDVFISNWIQNRDPDGDYHYNWDLTEKTVTFTLKYTGDLTGELGGTSAGDWVLTTTGEYFGQVGVAYIGKAAEVTYTDGVEGVELFADQVIDAVVGASTPAFEGTPTREGYDFAGWTPEVSETVTESITYTATWTPNAPKQANVTSELVAVICDSDPDRHATVYGKWYPLGHCKTTSDITWNEELGTWTVDVRIGSLYIMYVDQLEDANNGTTHELVEDITSVNATLKWDAEKLMWFPTEPIELHTTCRTAPTAPTHNQLDAYQIKLYGYVNGVEKVYTTSLPEGGYTIGEVKGSREEGFTVDITVTLEDGDAFVTNWIAQKNPGKTYLYDWDKTEKTVTFTLKYNGSLTGTLYGHRHASNTNYDWVLATTGKTWGVVSEGYIKQQVVVTYTDGVENAEIFADETYTVFVGDATPAFQGKAERNGYTFLGWTPEVSETVADEVTYVAQWVEQEPVFVYTVMGGDPTTTELLYSGRADNSANLVEWLNANVEVPVKKGYAPEYWFYLNDFGTKVAEDALVDVWNTVYINYTVCTHTWGEPVLDTENLTHTYTCEICSETRVENVVAWIESTCVYYETLDAALEAANQILKAGKNSETVTLVADVTECVNVTWTAAQVSTITIDLNGHTVTGDGSGAVFYFVKGNAGTGAKNISIVINDSVGTGKVTGGVGYTNKTSTYGGAIYVNSNLGGTLTINGGTFTGNTANVGGAIHSASTNVVINGGVFTGNTAKNGGAIYASNLTITGGEIYGNTANGEVTETSTGAATAGGGGIAVRGAEVHLTITGGKIYGNTADGWGDDILYIHTNTRTNSDMVLIDAASMGEEFDGWYVDGLNGTYKKGRTDRFGAGTIVEFTDLSVDNTEAKSMEIALKAAYTYSVTYTDGVEGEEVFADQVLLAVPGTATPAFPGTPAREGYNFIGWTPEVAETVSADAVYTAQWELIPASGKINGYTTRSDNEGLSIELQEIYAYESVEVKVYSGETVLTTLSWKEEYIEKQTLLDYLTCSFRTYDESTQWAATEWTPLDNVIPTKIELYVDGMLMDTMEMVLDPDVWADLKGTEYGMIVRISGNTRSETAFKAANELKEVLGIEKFDSIIIASGDNFADALAGSYLAAVKGAPILLYRSSALAENVAYITENLAAGGTVYILGGTASVDQNFEDQLTGLNVERLSGPSRFDTNLVILKEGNVTGGEILVATGWNFADCLSASATGKPILLVNSSTNKLTDSQIEYLSSLTDAKFTIIGGTASVSEELETALKAYGDVDRVSGATREETSVKVAERYFSDPDRVVVAYSRNFPDGLCAGPLAYAMGAPLLLTNAGAEAAAKTYVETNGITKGLILGGTASVSDETVRTIFQMAEADEIVVK